MVTGDFDGKGGHEDIPAHMSDVVAGEEPLPDVTVLGVGPALRVRRESLGWSLPDVATWLRIRLSYLEALEQGRPADLPGTAYAIGFLRTYASALGFPAEQVVARFRHEARGLERKPDLTFPAPVPERTVPAGAIVLAGAFVVICAYGGWYWLVGREPAPLERVPTVASVMPGMSSQSRPSPQIASVMPGASPSPRPIAPAARSANIPPAASAPVAGVAPDVTQQPTAESQPEVATAVPLQEVPAPPTVETPPPVVADAGTTPQIRANAASWVQVRGAGGKVVYDHIMQPGDTWSAPTEGGPFTLTVGNAGGVALAMGETMTPPLGRNGGVRRNIPLTPDAIRDGSVATTGAQKPGTALPVTPSGSADGLPLPPPPVTTPRARPPVARPAEPSADDLNAMQLQSGHPVRPAGGVSAP